MEKMEKMICESKKMIMDWGRLPTCIGTTIFSKLVISDLPICRLVCKTWNHTVLDYASAPQFQCLTGALLICTHDEAISIVDDSFKLKCNAKMQCMNFDSRKHLHANLDLELELMKSPSLLFDGNRSIHIINQCNGLLYIITVDYECHGMINHEIFNPMTNEFLQVPWTDEYRYDAIGFGCSTSTKQYKLFRVRTTLPNEAFRKRMEIDVLRFGNDNKWRSLPFFQPSSSHKFVCSAYLNGVIYWLGKLKRDRNKVVIYALDVETEKFESSTILEVGRINQEILNIYNFNKTIYATFITLVDATYKYPIQIWKMQGKNSWSIQEVLNNDTPNDHSRDLAIIKEAFEDREHMVNFRIFCFSNSIFGRMRKKIVSWYQEERSIWKIESLNFGSLSNILAGDSQD